MKTMFRALLIALFLPLFAFAQDKPADTPADNPLTSHHEHLYSGVTRIVLKTAEVMPEENYAFKPADSVRTFGQILGHIADSQYVFCSKIVDEKSPRPEVEKTKSTKAELIAALRDAFGYCNRAYDTLNDRSAATLTPMFRDKAPKLGVLTVNAVHTIEHYGNLVTYMRIKNLVPPTSDPAFMAELGR